MHVRTTTRQTRRTARWRLSAVGASVVMTLSLATLVSSTTPSFASTHLRSASSSTYCQLLISYNKKQTAANKALETPGAAVAAMQAAFRNLKAEESIVLGVAPGSLQSSYKLIFKDLNVIYADLSKAHFNYLKLTHAQIATFEGLSKSMASAGARITAYNKSVCGVNA